MELHKKAKERAEEKSLAFLLQKGGTDLLMNYEIFKEVVAEKFKDSLPEEYRNMKLLVHPI